MADRFDLALLDDAEIEFVVDRLEAGLAGCGGRSFGDGGVGRSVIPRAPTASGE
jgi:hypothetical protein